MPGPNLPGPSTPIPRSCLYLREEEHEEYRTNRSALKREYSKLDRFTGGQIYFSKTDYDFSEDTVFSSIDGALPSQLGSRTQFPSARARVPQRENPGPVRPSTGKFRERFLAASIKNHTRAASGCRYKPLGDMNAIASIERLFKMGDSSENNWLWRVLGSHEWGEKAFRQSDAFHDNRQALWRHGFLSGGEQTLVLLP